MTITAPTTELVTAPADTDPAAQEEAFAEKVFGALLGAQETQAAFVGHRLGWYQALVDGPLTSTELAERTGTAERYAREWLEHQTVAGWLACDNPGADHSERRFRLPPAHVAVLTDPESLSHVLPFACLVAGLGKHLDTIIGAYRTGGGVSWAELGEDPREAQAAGNRPLFVKQLGHELLASVPDIDAALRAGGRVADIGAGFAWSSIGVAQAYPAATVDAYDIDAPSVEAARRNIAEAGLADRVRAHCVDAGTIDPDQPYDLVMAENVGETFTGEPDDVERLMYGVSLMCCLPDGKAHECSVETGTVMRPSTFEGYAIEAGFSSVEILPIDNDFFRFYRLR